jgi:hypothetical protein
MAGSSISHLSRGQDIDHTRTRAKPPSPTQRRYALFTLVGIASEDDLDAPDLAVGTTLQWSRDRPTDSKNLSSASVRLPLQQPDKAARGGRPGFASLN